jgi:hypothetical protein
MFDKLTVDGFAKHMDELEVPRSIGCVFIHHTAGLRKHWKGRSSVIAIDNYHREVRGWWGIGYNYIVDCNTPNVIWTGRPLSRTGAHALIEPVAASKGPRWTEFPSSYPNVHGVGVCIPGSYNVDHVDRGCYDTLAQVVAIICNKFKLDDPAIGYHEEVANKVCPGSAYNFPSRKSFVELVSRYKIGGFGNARFKMNNDPEIPAWIDNGISYIRRSDAELIADKYNLRIPDTDKETVPIRGFLAFNLLPSPGFDPSSKLITGFTPDYWTNVRLIINDVPAGRVWMKDAKGMGRVEDIAKFSGWLESKLPQVDGYVLLRELAEQYPNKVILSTAYWETQRKVYLYMDNEDFHACESLSQHEITADPTEHT